VFESKTPTDFLTNLVFIPIDLAFPAYGFYGGHGYGIKQFPTGNPAPLNKVDVGSFGHDKSGNDIDWIVTASSQDTPGLPAGIFGWGYVLIGTPFFYLHGKITGQSCTVCGR